MNFWAVRYCAVLLVAYSVDGGAVKVVDLASGETLPPEILDALTNDNVQKWAYNANHQIIAPDEWRLFKEYNARDVEVEMEIKFVIPLINGYAFAEPLIDQEIQKVTRDEAIEKLMAFSAERDFAGSLRCKGQGDKEPKSRRSLPQVRP